MRLPSLTPAPARVSRRALLRSSIVLGSGLSLLTSCGISGIATAYPSPTASAQPSASITGQVPSPTPLTTPADATAVIPKAGTPQRIAALFLGNWNVGHFTEMYALLSAEAKASISQDKFVQRYTAVTQEATIVRLSATLRPGQLETSPNQAYDVRMETALVGTLTQNNVLPMIPEPDGWKVQWLPSLMFKELTGDNLIHMFPVTKARGGIIDRNGAPLAIEGPALSVDVVPKDTPDLAKTAKDLSDLLKIPPQDIQKALDKVQGHPEWRAPIKTFTPEQLAPSRDKLKTIPGITLTEVRQRGYAQGRVACHIVGYRGEISPDELSTMWRDGYLEGDRVGKAGIEHWAEHELAGHRGGKLAVITPDGSVWTNLAEQDATSGKNVQLTIDINLQKAAEEALGKLAGAAIVMRVQDGSLLAAASNPGYDPNVFIVGLSEPDAAALFNDPQHPFENRVASGLYPTGSIFKTITMSLMLQNAFYTPTSTFSCPGHWEVAGKKLLCWKQQGHGTINLVEGLAQSCDVVYYICGQTADKQSHTLLPDFAKEFGLGTASGVLGLQETAGVVPNPTWKQQALNEIWFPGDAVNLAVGQGALLTTPLQVASWIAAIANGGTLWTPRIVDKIVTPGGGDVDPNPPKAHAKLPVSAANLAIVRDGMRRTVGEFGIGTGSWAFRDFPIAIAGKTGTAESGKPKPHAWFASFAPYDKPEVVVVTMVEFADGEGSEIAAPIARQIYEHYFNVIWQDGVRKDNRICTEVEYLCPFGGGKKVRYGD